jgi:ferrochelatase
MNQIKTGVLLINLGTPNNCDPKSVYSYLKQFLNDPRVIDLPKFVRYILVNGLIIPFRYKKSAHAYKQIWAEKGSPLLINSENLVNAIKKELGTTIEVELGMRYGNPSIESAVKKLKNCQKIIAIPLFPQYSSAATGSAVEELLRVIQCQWNIPEIIVKRDFFNNVDFIKAYASIIKENICDKQIDKLIFSYHGLPKRHIEKSNCTAKCSHEKSCPAITQQNIYCYRAQCFATSDLIAKELNLNSNNYVTSFQSRLGKTPWIQPYTDLVLKELREEKVTNIAIVCPSFVNDCLETLEEINIRARDEWQSLGGVDFNFIPCLNDNSIWVKGVVKIINQLNNLS